MCAERGCLFCGALDRAVREMIDTSGPASAAGAPRKERKRTRHQPPFKPFYKGVHWNWSRGKWVATYNKRIIEVSEGTADGHYQAGLAYAQLFGKDEPLPRGKGRV